ncbi:hypothetical protein [Streptomyces sp. NPDC047928]|uniref:hypothetical protein n=1 Tax=unclassified Streptomyces TaxID=2593676 RepID=UPI003723B47C
MSVRRVADRWWTALALFLCGTVLTWLLAWLWTGVSELDERCGHGLVGPGGPFRIERSGFPPNLSCVYEDGTTISAADGLGWAVWACVAGVAICAVVAFALEFTWHLAGPARAVSATRLRTLSFVCAAALAAHYAAVVLVTGPPGREPLSICSAFTTGVYRRADEVRRAVFPPQTTCVYPDGGTYDLVAGWVGALAWLLLAALAASVTATLLTARRRRRAEAG